jgi:hypothetical protein
LVVRDWSYNDACECAGTFFAATMWLSALSVVASIYILLLHHNEAVEPIQGIVRLSKYIITVKNLHI